MVPIWEGDGASRRGRLGHESKSTKSTPPGRTLDLPRPSGSGSPAYTLYCGRHLGSRRYSRMWEESLITNWDAAYSINKYGWSVGISAAPGGIGPAATLWSPSGTGTYLQNPINSSDPSWAVSISNSGYVVGWVQVGGGDSAVLWSPSGTPTLLASGSTVSQVNASGQSIGQIVEGPNLSGAALWSSTGGLTILQGLGGSTYAKAINKYGDVVGMAINGSSGLPEAVIWSPTGNVAVLQDNGGLGL